MPTLESLNNPWRTRCQNVLCTILRSQDFRDACAQILDRTQTQKVATQIANVEYNLPLLSEPTPKSRAAVLRWLDNFDINTVSLEDDLYSQARAVLDLNHQDSLDEFVAILLFIIRPLLRACLRLCLEREWGAQDDTIVQIAQDFGEEIVFGGIISWEDERVSIASRTHKA